MILNTTTGAAKKLPVLNGSYPADVTVNAGTGAVFRVVIAQEGMPSEYTYQWYVNDIAVSGATSAEYTRDTAQDKGVYSVYCQVTNRAGTVISPRAVLTVRTLPVLDGSCPADITVVKHTEVTLQVSAVEAGYPDAYTYQWYDSGTAVSGATGESYTFTPTAAGTREIYCMVTNAAGTVASRTAIVTVTDLYLYNAGDTCDAVTGGWDSVVANAAHTFLADSIEYSVSGSEDQHGALYTKNKIDLTNFSTLYARINATKVSTDPKYTSIGIHSANTSASATPVAYSGTTVTGEQTLALDISDCTDAYYVGFRNTMSAGYIYEIWME